jgi:S-adenosylmethionine decarboxylase
LEYLFKYKKRGRFDNIQLLRIMQDIAPHIFRKRFLIEGYYHIPVREQTIVSFFGFITDRLALRTYGAPIVHATGGEGKEENQGFDAFVPLIDSGIYLGVWANQKFLSLIIYTCKDFDEAQALEETRRFFGLGETVSTVF